MPDPMQSPLVVDLLAFCRVHPVFAVFVVWPAFSAALNLTEAKLAMAERVPALAPLFAFVRATGLDPRAALRAARAVVPSKAKP